MTSSMTPTPKARRLARRLLIEARDRLDGAGTMLLELYRPYLLTIANQEFDPALRAKAGPSDLVQETLIRATKLLPENVQREEADFRAWLRQILIRRLEALRQHYRRTAKRQVRREQSLDDVSAREYLQNLVTDSDQTPGSQAVAQERRERVRQAIDRLPAEYRRIILWHNRDGLGWPQIAKKLDRSPDAARMLWNRAMRKLTERLRADRDSP